jgi:hypothetical protein
MNATDGLPPNVRNKANYIAAKAAYNARELVCTDSTRLASSYRPGI